MQRVLSERTVQLTHHTHLLRELQSAVINSKQLFLQVFLF